MESKSMSFEERSLPGGVRGDIFQSAAPAAVEHGTSFTSRDAGSPSHAASDGGTGAGAMYAGLFDGPAVTRPSSSEPWRGTPWMTPEQIADDDSMIKLIEANAHKPPIYGPTIPPPHARDTIGQGSAAAVEANQREAVWRATPEFNKGMPVDKTLRAKTDLERVLASGKGVNAGFKWLNQFSGAIAPGVSRGLPVEGGIPALTPTKATPMPIPMLPEHELY
jgi:hypothetical protein